MAITGIKKKKIKGRTHTYTKHTCITFGLDVVVVVVVGGTSWSLLPSNSAAARTALEMLPVDADLTTNRYPPDTSISLGSGLNGF